VPGLRSDRPPYRVGEAELFGPATQFPCSSRRLSRGFGLISEPFSLTLGLGSGFRGKVGSFRGPLCLADGPRFGECRARISLTLRRRTI
jgi:hypothetical protein